MRGEERGLRELKNARTQAAIVRAGLERMVEVGFESATVAEIAARAEVSPRTVYAWFAAKEDIVLAGAGHHTERLAIALEAEGGTVLDRVRGWVADERARNGDPDDLTRLRERVILASERLQTLDRGRHAAAEKLIADAIARESGREAHDAAPRALAAAITAVLHAMHLKIADDQEPDIAGLEGAYPMLDAAFRALLEPPLRTAAGRCRAAGATSARSRR